MLPLMYLHDCVQPATLSDCLPLMLPAIPTLLVSQILGSVFGSLIYAGLIPGLTVGATIRTGETAPGCFGPAAGVTNGELFWWEVFMTFLLVVTVYAAAVAKPGHGNTAPLAIGLSLYAAALTGVQLRLDGAVLLACPYACPLT